jgi:hypothetical protein
MNQNITSVPANSGTRLCSALTVEQIQTLLDVAVESGHLQAMNDQLQVADPDLANAVRRVLAEPGRQSEALVSSQKTVEIWNELWEAWADHVADVADEKGPYANHEEHWHPPYLDHGALEADLEEAADALSEWIERASPLVKEPDLFLESLTELNKNMQSLPEWFQPVEDDFVLGPKASTCVLRWTWLGLANQPEPGRKLLDTLCGLEGPGKHAELLRDACCQFIEALPDGVCREIHTYLRQPQFAEKLIDLRSVWHRIQHEFESRFDPTAHLQACEEHLEQDWHYGEPLISDAISRRDFIAAEKFIELTLSSLLRWAGDEPWRPEKLLLPRDRYYHRAEEDQATLTLLDRWEQVAARLESRQRVAALRLQRAILQSPEDWSRVLAAFAEQRPHFARHAVLERLFAEWRQRIADACAQPDYGKKTGTDTWVHRLIDAQRDPASGQESFLEQVEVWLDCCREHLAFFQKNWRFLALLTRQLPHHGELRAACPTFHDHVLVPALQVSAEMEKSLRQALASLGEKANKIEVRPVWEGHLHRLVPSPGGSGSYYRESALWMRALSEVYPASYGKLLGRWKTEFARRRNLWKDMATAGCPGL